MPELPEVETVRRGLAPHMEGACFAKIEQRRPDLRFPFPENFVTRLTGRRVEHVGRRAKYLTLDLEDGKVLVMHLGMSGSFLVEPALADPLDGMQAPGNFHYERSHLAAHNHVIFQMSNGAHIVFNDPRRFGFMDLVERARFDQSKHFLKMGVEPTGNALQADYLSRRFHGKSAPLKAALLDQRIIAGLGNIYVCEALWRAGLSPRRASGSLVTKTGQPGQRVVRLVDCVRQVIADAIEAGGSTLRDYVHTDGSLGYFQHRFAVYDQEGNACKKSGCNGTIRRIVQSGRSTFYCPVCQR